MFRNIYDSNYWVENFNRSVIKYIRKEAKAV